MAPPSMFRAVDYRPCFFAPSSFVFLRFISSFVAGYDESYFERLIAPLTVCGLKSDSTFVAANEAS